MVTGKLAIPWNKAKLKIIVKNNDEFNLRKITQYILINGDGFNMSGRIVPCNSTISKVNLEQSLGIISVIMRENCG